MSAYKGLGSGRHNSALAPLSGATAEDGTTVTTFKRSKSWRCTWTCTRSTGGVTVDDVAKAHAGDLAIQDSHGVKYLRYWVDESNGKIFCLVDAPDADAANTVHREAHGLVADEIYSVTEGA